MRIREYEFDGTPDEFIKVAPVLRSGGQGREAGPVSSGQGLSGETEDGSAVSDRKLVTVEQATKIITRRKVSKHIETVLRELYHAGDTKLTSDQLKKALGFDDASDERGADRFRGMMGAFSRRVAHDVGSETRFFDDEWNADKGQKEWRLPVPVRQAIEQLGWFPLASE